MESKIGRDQAEAIAGAEVEARQLGTVAGSEGSRDQSRPALRAVTAEEWGGSAGVQDTRREGLRTPQKSLVYPSAYTPRPGLRWVDGEDLGSHGH